MSWLLIAGILSSTQTIRGSTIVVEAAGFSATEGACVVAFFPGDCRPPVPLDLSGACRIVVCPITESSARAVVTGLAHGAYIVLAFHDADLDGCPDPGEELAVPDARPPGADPSGPPSFDGLGILHKTVLTEIPLVVIGTLPEGSGCIPS